MEKRTYRYKALKYDELSEEAKDKAIEAMGDINVDYEWWDCTVDYIAGEWAEKYGIEFEQDSICFDLDRGAYLYFHGPGKIHVINPYKLAYHATGNKGYALLAARGILDLGFETHHYGGGSGRTALDVTDYRSAESPDLPVDFDQWFRELCHDFLKQLRNEYEGNIGREAIEDTIRINEYDFFEDGNRTKTFAA